MKKKLKLAYMKTAETFAELSHAKRLHVGAIIVKDDRIISIGYNGMPAGWENNCEDKVWMTEEEQRSIHPDKINEMYPHYGEQLVGDYVQNGRYRLKTKPEVLHAETNAIAKLARSGEHGLDSDLFVTHAPCMDCAKLIYQAGIRRVFFRTGYRDNSGVDFLKASGIQIEQLDLLHEERKESLEKDIK
jgi:dCMP deaminase